MKHNTKGTFDCSTPVRSEKMEEEILTDFDYQMINEMKKTDELQNWTDDQLKQYCLVLRNYTQIIYHLTDKNNNYCNEEKERYNASAIVGSTFLYPKGSLKSKILA